MTDVQPPTGQDSLPTGCKYRLYNTPECPFLGHEICLSCSSKAYGDEATFTTPEAIERLFRAAQAILQAPYPRTEEKVIVDPSVEARREFPSDSPSMTTGTRTFVEEFHRTFGDSGLRIPESLLEWLEHALELRAKQISGSLIVRPSKEEWRYSKEARRKKLLREAQKLDPDSPATLAMEKWHSQIIGPLKLREWTYDRDNKSPSAMYRVPLIITGLTLKHLGIVATPGEVASLLTYVLRIYTSTSPDCNVDTSHEGIRRQLMDQAKKISFLQQR